MTWVSSDIIEKHFSLPPIPVGLPTKAELNLETVHFNRYISSDKAIVEFEKMGLRPAILLILLAFGEKYPDEQRKYPIVALGSIWQRWYGHRDVPYLWGHADERFLNLVSFEYEWHPRYRFLVVRES